MALVYHNSGGDMLNLIWLGFFILSLLFAVLQVAVLGQWGVWQAMVESLFSMAKLSVEISIGLVGALSFWLGVMKVAEQGGLVQLLARGLAPLFGKLMPEVPAGHPALGSISMNLGANLLGLDNAATPFGIKAMQELQTLNPNPEQASNAQILFLVLNTSSVTLFPIAVFVYRAQQGALAPTDVFIPILLATSASTLVGLLTVCLIQRINLWQRSLVIAGAVLFALLGGLICYFASLSAAALQQQSAILANGLIFGFVVAVLCFGHAKRVQVYDSFIEGAKQGFQFAVTLIPYLVAMLCAIGVFRASGGLDWLVKGLACVVDWLGLDNRFIDAMPVAMMKPLSGSGARAMMLETMANHGVDSFAGRLAAIIQGSTETTFYVLAVYFGAVGIKYARHAVFCGLMADLAGVLAAIAVCYWFFG